MAVHTTGQSFRLALAKHGREMPDEAMSDLAKAVAIRALRGVVMSTRVDTGRARGNWQVGESMPPEGYDQSLAAPGGRSDASIDRREDPIARGNREIGRASGLDIIWLHNGVPYIGILEDWDKMVAGDVAALRTWLASG